MTASESNDLKEENRWYMIRTGRVCKVFSELPKTPQREVQGQNACSDQEGNEWVKDGGF
jgi:hypothetical protein